MHRPARRPSVAAFPWPARILALSGLAVISLGLVLLPNAPRSLAQASGSSRPAGITVRGPRMLNPATINANTGAARLFPNPSTVTVSQATDLVNQTIQVTWAGFTPSTIQPGDAQPGYDPATTLYPVMILQCRGVDPAFGQCFGDDGGIANALGTPSNAQFTVTTRGGRGVADIQIYSQVQNQQLGCSPTQRCSLVIISAQGGGYDANDNAASCANHISDNDPALGLITAIGSTDFVGGTSNDSGFLCSWQKRIVVPLTFSPAAVKACPIQNADLSIEGSPMMSRAMAQWDIALCDGANPLRVGFIPSSESLAIQDVQAAGGFLSSHTDIALTTRPAASTVSGNVRYTYAPVAVSAVSIAYWADNPGTGEPYTYLRLNPRLVAKMLTTSYNLGSISCTTDPVKNPPPHVDQSPCDPNIGRNPADIFQDPEFTSHDLNPGMRPPGDAPALEDVPIVPSGHSDMTYEVTRWIAADQAAQQFLGGQPDPWGMHVDSSYLPSGQQPHLYPTDAFIPQDPSPQPARGYSPVFPLSLVVTAMLTGQPPGTFGYVQLDSGDPAYNYQKLPQETAGQRALFSVLDYGDAAAYLMPSAAILNHAGHYVQPTPQSMSAALQSMTTSSNGITQQVNTDSNNPAEYPLTMVIYAMVPTSGVSSTKAAAIARWLRFVAGPGQAAGSAPGQLATGYLPLTASLRAEAMSAANAVQNQSGTPVGHNHHTPSTNPTTSPSASPSPGGKLHGSKPSSGLSLPKVGPKITLVSVRNPQTAGGLRYVLPITLIAGGFAAVLGSSLMVGDTGAALGAWILRVFNLRTLRNVRSPRKPRKPRNMRRKTL
jgi:hypothetical protein